MNISGNSKLCANKTCGKVMDVPRPGWRCGTDCVTELCNACFVAYNLGKFCDIYHTESKCWRRCKSCQKRLHCACIVSQLSYIPVKHGGVKCLACAPPQAILLANRYMSEHAPFLLSNNTIRSGHVPCNRKPFWFKSSKIKEDGSKNSKNTTPSVMKDQDSIPSKEPATPSPTPLASVGPKLVAKGEKPHQEKVSEKDGERITPPAFVTGCSRSKSSKTHTEKEIQYRYTPRLTDEELKQIYRGSNEEVTPLFEKVLTTTDTGKIGRLVLPKKCAELYFPSIEFPEGESLKIQDLEGKDWDFKFRFWQNSKSRIYVLEGFNYYVDTMKLQKGDTVMFCRLEPERKLVIGYRNNTTTSTSMKEMITETTSNDVSKGKTTSVTIIQEKPKDPISVHSDVVGSNPSILSKRKRSEKTKPNHSVSVDVVGPKAECGKRRRYELGSTSKSIDHENKMKNLDLAFKEAQEHENVNVLPKPLNPTKKHPRHRPGCSCVVCIQGSKNGHRKPTSQPENIPTPPEVGGFKSYHHPVVVNGGSQEDENTERSSGSGLKRVENNIDLNELPEVEPDDDSKDAVVPVQEIPPGGDHI